MTGLLARTFDPWETWREGALPVVQEILRSDVTVFYQLGLDDERIRLDRFVGLGLDHAARESLRPVLEVERNRCWGFYDPLRPQQRQRNRPLTRSELRAVQPKADESEALRAWSRRVGLANSDQVRVLVCAGSRLLGWLGAFRRRPFTGRERAVLGAMTAPVRGALLRAEQWEHGCLALRLLHPTLEAVAAPAFILDHRGRLVHANTAGQAALRLDRALAATLKDAVLRPSAPPRFSVTTLSERGVPAHHLVVVQAQAADAAAKVAGFAAAWKLTPREAQVLRLLADGHSNKHISVTLGSAVATVEIHVSRVLAKSQSGSRAALAARFWR